MEDFTMTKKVSVEIQTIEGVSYAYASINKVIIGCYNLGENFSELEFFYDNQRPHTGSNDLLDLPKDHFEKVVFDYILKNEEG